jgi:hypothetical protein
MIIEHPAESLPCLADRCSAAVSSSRRFTHTGSATLPRRLNRSRVTRCRTSVTIWLASATRCDLSTAILASGRAGRIPEAYGGWSILLTGIVEAKDRSPADYRSLAWGLFLSSVGFAFGARYVDRSYIRRKFRVIHALDRLNRLRLDRQHERPLQSR